MRLTVMLSALGCALVLSGCAPTGLYAWGDYADDMFKHEQNDLTDQEYLARIEADLKASEKAGYRIPPGLYADVGTANLKLGNAEAALVYYEKERNLWPESRDFMDMLIKGVKRNLESFKGTAK